MSGYTKLLQNLLLVGFTVANLRLFQDYCSSGGKGIEYESLKQNTPRYPMRDQTMHMYSRVDSNCHVGPSTCKSYQVSVFFSICFSFAIPSHEQMFQREASGNEVGGEEGAVLDAENNFPACAFEGLFAWGKALLGKFLEVRGERKKTYHQKFSFFVMLPMTTSKVKTISSPGGDLL